MTEKINEEKYLSIFCEDNQFLFKNIPIKNYEEYFLIGLLTKYISQTLNIFYQDLSKIKIKEISLEEIESPYIKSIIILLKYINEITTKINIIKDEFTSLSDKINKKNLRVEEIDKIKIKLEDTKLLANKSSSKIEDYYNKYKKLYSTNLEEFIKLKVCKDTLDNNNKAFYNIKKDIGLSKTEYVNEIYEYNLQRKKIRELQENSAKFQEAFKSDLSKLLIDNLSNFNNKLYEVANNNGLNNFNTLFEIKFDTPSPTLKKKSSKSLKYINCPPKIKPKPCEFSVDCNFIENCKIFKSRLKNKTVSEMLEKVDELNKIAKELIDEINKPNVKEIEINLYKIGEKLRNNKLTNDQFTYLINVFQDSYDLLFNWEDPLFCPNLKKYKELNNNLRFVFIDKFLIDLNRSRNKFYYFDSTNFDYLSIIMKKILELNEDLDKADYNSIEMIIMLGNTFYTKINEVKKYIIEEIQGCPIFASSKFWTKFTKQIVNKHEKENTSTTEGQKSRKVSTESNKEIPLLNLGKNSLLVSVIYNILLLITDSSTLNAILFNIFKDLKICLQERNEIVKLIESEISDKNLNYLQVNKDKLLSDK